MPQVSLFGLFLSMTLAASAAFTSGATQVTLFVAAGCVAVSLVLATFVDHRGNRARDEAIRHLGNTETGPTSNVN